MCQLPVWLRQVSGQQQTGYGGAQGSLARKRGGCNQRPFFIVQFHTKNWMCMEAAIRCQGHFLRQGKGNGTSLPVNALPPSGLSSSLPAWWHEEAGLFTG